MGIYDLQSNVLNLVQSMVPTMEALELLVFIAKNPDRQIRPMEVVNDMRPTLINEAVVEDHLALFASQGVVSKLADDLYQYRPNRRELEECINALVKEYNERPVTLIQAVYAIARENKARVFADAFKIR